MNGRSSRAVAAFSLAIALVGAASSAGAQVRHRRPMGPAPTVNYHFDNNSAGGSCRDYNCGGRCYDGHSGTDFSLGVGTDVLAGADGTVIATNNGCANTGYVGNPCGGRCGNYVQLQHSDGSRSIYCHMQLNSLRVSNGQRVRCGQVIGRSASSGSSSGPHLHFGWRRSASAASQDSYRGRCTSSPGAWVDQNSYPQSPAGTCQCVPSGETCNNRDDDCDGRVDDGISRACYTGPAGTAGRGICRQGTQTCSAGSFGACAGQVVPRAETCNRMDDDCDGMVDEGVCQMDAGATDAGRDASSDARADARTDGAAADAQESDVEAPDASESDASEGDANAGDASEEDAEFDDVAIEEDADVSPDRVDVPSGCGCETPAAPANDRATGVIVMMGVATVMASRRRKARR
ncbi:MAG: peptidoglycan DD-metalloendopeptidase family protein [Myxococcales bacterium]|nr:peptidoglycan DD-metalloendopeptidase family protein [Myxococcales bacterium]